MSSMSTASRQPFLDILKVCQWRINGMVLLVFVNVVYEYYCTKIGVHHEVYRICIFRHLGVVALGAFSASLLESGLICE